MEVLGSQAGGEGQSVWGQGRGHMGLDPRADLAPLGAEGK